MASPHVRNYYPSQEVFKRTAVRYGQSDCALVGPALNFVDVVNQGCGVHNTGEGSHGHAVKNRPRFSWTR